MLMGRNMHTSARAHRRGALPAVLSVALISASLGLPAVTVSAGCDMTWAAIDTDDNRSGHALFGLAARGDRSIWVVGTKTGRGGVSRPLIKRWNGSRWSSEKTSSTPRDTYLVGADAPQEGPPLAVGNGGGQTVALKRGRDRWKRTATASPGWANEFRDVAVVSRKKAWAAGAYISGDYRAFIQRWNGSRWRTVPLSQQGILNQVSASGGRNAWAVGITVRNDVGRTLALSYNGKGWRRVRSPNKARGFHTLQAVETVSTKVAWAGGYGRYDGGNRPIFMRWNGTRWKMAIPRKLKEAGKGFVSGISVHGDEVVVIGEIGRWNKPFILVKGPSGWDWADMTDLPRWDENVLYDVDHSTSGTVYVAGYRSTNGGSEVVLRRGPACSP